MRALLKNYRQAPRKVRLVVDAIRGKNIDRALLILSHMDKRAALPIQKLVKAAVRNAKEQGVEKEGLTIKRISVDKGHVFKKFMPRARGRATPIRKRTSHITLELASNEAKG